MRKKVWCLLALLISAEALAVEMLISATPLAAEVPDRQSEVYGDWTVRCIKRENAPPCDMVQFAHRKESGEQVMQFSLAFAGEEDRYGVQVILPLGILIQPGVVIRVDEKADITDFEVTRCERQGCFIERLVTGKDIQPFKGGNKGLIAVFDRQGEALILPLSFAGFSKSLEVMTKRNRTWAKKYKQGD
ncbi:MAG: invasion associated locus B family protein [Rhodospirillales bacterium]|nr:invasion associated locus B family protein [Rhodospirillales bacterium]